MLSKQVGMAVDEVATAVASYLLWATAVPFFIVLQWATALLHKFRSYRFHTPPISIHVAISQA